MPKREQNGIIKQKNLQAVPRSFCAALRYEKEEPDEKYRRIIERTQRRTNQTRPRHRGSGACSGRRRQRQNPRFNHPHRVSDAGKRRFAPFDSRHHVHQQSGERNERTRFPPRRYRWHVGVHHPLHVRAHSARFRRKRRHQQKFFHLQRNRTQQRFKKGVQRNYGGRRARRRAVQTD